MNTIPRNLLTSLVLLFSVALSAQTSIFETWRQNDSLYLTIIADWDTLWAMPDESYLDATLLVDDQEWDVELRLRGRYRRAKCDVPPFQLKFKKKHLEERGYKDFNKLKVVTHCLNEDQVGEQNLYEEMLVYDLYQLITDNSFRYVEAFLTYTYPDDRKPSFTARSFLLEPSNEIADRLGGEELEDVFNYPEDSLDADNYNRVALFEFMVCNNDWDHSVLQNVKLVDRPSGHSILVPYDFDFSALVAPSYGRVTQDFPVTDYRDRVYLGKLFHDDLDRVIQEYIDKQDVILDYVKDYEHLEKSRRRSIVRYLRSFFTFLKMRNTDFSYGMILPYQS